MYKPIECSECGAIPQEAPIIRNRLIFCDEECEQRYFEMAYALAFAEVYPEVVEESNE